VRQALSLAPHLPRVDRCWSSHARRTLETAARLTRLPPEPSADLAEADFGRWSGKSLDEVHAEEAESLQLWLDSPGAAPHGGETLERVRTRARRVLDRTREHEGPTLVVSHGGFIKVVLLEVLGLPDSAIWQLDLEPASLTELHPSGPRWRITRLNWTPRL